MLEIKIENWRTLPTTTSFVNNSTYMQCLRKIDSGIKSWKYRGKIREEELDEIQKNLECALEKYGEKIKKHPGEEPLSLMGRTIQRFVTFSIFYSNNVNAIDELIEKSQNDEQQITNTRGQK